jgi:hypothetical protein
MVLPVTHQIWLLVDLKSVHNQEYISFKFFPVRILWIFLSLLFLFSCRKPEEIVSKYDPYVPEGWKISKTGLWIPENVFEIIGLKTGPFIRLTDGSILTAEGTKCLISNDEGYSWTSYNVFPETGKYTISERALIQTKQGIIILAFYNTSELSNWNWQTTIHDSPGAILPTYAVRSLDGGKTWQDLQKLHDEWTGSIRDIIETNDGSIVFTSMMMQHNPGRHSVLTYTSKDDGKSWIRSNIIDLGGVGHHGGVTEATIEQLRDGQIWMLMRTNWGYFWEAFSDNEGLTWKNFKATGIDASSAPGNLFRLKSGRLVLIWNRYYPEGKTSYTLTGGDSNWSEVPVSNHREELAIMFSADDGKNWSTPHIVARCTAVSAVIKKNNVIAYPYIFENKPGNLWITTGQGNLKISLSEKDYL